MLKTLRGKGKPIILSKMRSSHLYLCLSGSLLCDKLYLVCEQGPIAL